MNDYLTPPPPFFSPSSPSCGPILSILEDVLLHSQRPATLQAAHTLLQTLTSNPKLVPALEHGGAGGMLNEILEDAGLEGLWQSGVVFPPSRGTPSAQQEQLDRQCFGLTEKLIEVSFFLGFFFLAHPWFAKIYLFSGCSNAANHDFGTSLTILTDKSVSVMQLIIM